MKRLLLIVFFALLGSFGNTFANDPIHNNGPHTLGSLNCDITSNVVYYKGTQGIFPADNFDGDTGFHRKISVTQQNSWYSIANNGLFNAPSFQFASNGKPKNQGTVTAVAATSAASIGTTIPAGYQRSQIAAQIVYHLKRWSYVDGGVPVPVYFTPVGGSTQNVTMNTSPNASSTQEENECRNIHVAFCGDGIRDNGTASSSSNINTPLNGGEQCDGAGQAQCAAGNICNQTTCQCEQQPVGECGTVNGQTYYAFGDNGTALTQTTAGLCPAGQTVTNWAFNQTTHTFTWKCQGVGGLSPLCSATESYCGDGVLGTGVGYTNQEQCDGTGQAQCAVGNTCSQSTCQCQQQPPGVCGTINGQTYYAFSDNGTSLSQTSSGLCPTGQTVTNWAFNQNTHTFSWKCQGAGGVSQLCNVIESYCGDGIIGTGVGYSNQEQCDDGNTNPFDACVTYNNNVSVCKSPFCGDGYIQTNLGEQCDDGNTVSGDGCQSNCTLPSSPGVCGTLNGSSLYDFNNGGDAINTSTPGLCSAGTVANFIYNSTTHTWSWSCNSLNGGQNSSCSTSERRCGNNVIDPNSGESCDGTGQAQCGVGQTCQSCVCVGNPTNGVCGSVNTNTIYDANNSGDALNASSPGLCAQGTVTGFVYNQTTHIWSRSCNGQIGGQNVQCNAQEKRCGNNIVDPNSPEECDGTAGQCPAGQTCNTAVCYCVSTPPPVLTGACGGIDNTWIYDFNNAGDALSGGTPGLCAAGNVSLFVYNPTTHLWTWQCVGNGGTDLCTVGERRCGNGVVEAGTSEQCDDGNIIDTDSCSNQCTVGGTPPTTGSVCTITVSPVGGSTNSNLPYTGAVQCAGISADTASISCGNGTSINNISGECVYTGYGTYTLQCLQNGVAVPNCSSSLTLQKGGGGGGKDSSIVCGNGKLDTGEQCDEGILNGKAGSRCSSACTIPTSGGGGGGGFKPKPRTPARPDLPAKCAFVDPPSIQMGEILPFRRDLERGSQVQPVSRCHIGTEGKIDADGMMCHFTIESPDGKKHSLKKPCMETDLKQVAWYNDFQQGHTDKIQSNRGQSRTKSNERGMNVYGEYTISLDEITYSVCEVDQPATETRSATFKRSDPLKNADRVCQFNFAVTTPYFIQKGTTLSSLQDDKKTLESFRRIDGRTILEMSSLETIDKKSDSTAFVEMKENVYKQAFKAVQGVTVSNPLGAIDPTFKKIPSQEVYVIKKGFTLTHYGKKPFNDGNPTTIVLQGPGEIVIKGSLPGNVLLVAPEGTVLLQNTNCDSTDTIEATIVASAIKSTLQVANPNTSTTNSQRCDDGKLVVKGVVVTENTKSIEQIRDARRSTLNNWFDGNNSKADHIYAGAAFRIDTRPGTRSSLPPLAKSHKLFFTTQGHESAPETILNDVVLALFELMN